MSRLVSTCQPAETCQPVSAFVPNNCITTLRDQFTACSTVTFGIEVLEKGKKYQFKYNIGSLCSEEKLAVKLYPFEFKWLCVMWSNLTLSWHEAEDKVVAAGLLRVNQNQGVTTKTCPVKESLSWKARGDRAPAALKLPLTPPPSICGLDRRISRWLLPEPVIYPPPGPLIPLPLLSAFFCFHAIWRVNVNSW